MKRAKPDITEILNAYSAGEKSNLDAVFERVYHELKKIASREKRRFVGVETISASDLINEAYLKIIRSDSLNAENRAHFFAIASTAMRQVIINHVEKKHAIKRGGNLEKVTMTTMADNTVRDVETMLSINQALVRLKNYDEDLVSLVEMRFFAGLTEAEIAEVLGSSERTVRRSWKKAKALLQTCLEAG